MLTGIAIFLIIISVCCVGSNRTDYYPPDDFEEYMGDDMVDYDDFDDF